MTDPTQFTIVVPATLLHRFHVVRHGLGLNVHDAVAKALTLWTDLCEAARMTGLPGE